MKRSNFLIISENNTSFKKGTVIKDFTISGNDVIFEDKIIPAGSFIKLNEKLSFEDERQVKELIKNQIKYLFWNLYTKNSMLIGN